MLLHHTAEKILAQFDELNIESLLVTPLCLLIVAGIAFNYDPVAVESTVMVLIALSPIWLPLGLLVGLWISWMEYVRFQYWFKTEHVLMRVDLPPEVEKSPLAMELFFTSLWNDSGETTFLTRFLKGGTRPDWSFEIASNEGQISFYIYCRRAWKNITEARLYGQYPEARLTEVPDYTHQIPADLEGYRVHVAEYRKREPVQAVPILTYINYELDKDADSPEMKVDPMTTTLEWLADTGKGEYKWIQIMARARKQDQWHGWYFKRDSYVDDAHEHIADLLREAGKRVEKVTGGVILSSQALSRGPSLLTSGEKDRVEAIEHSLQKLPFECGVRILYIAKGDAWDGVNENIMNRFWVSYRYKDNNDLRNTRGTTNLDYPWQDWNEIRFRYICRQGLFFYKYRAYFEVPLEQTPVYFTTEELASLWHFPNSGVRTPGISRVPAKVSEAPANLPT